MRSYAKIKNVVIAKQKNYFIRAPVLLMWAALAASVMMATLLFALSGPALANEPPVAVDDSYTTSH